MPQYKNKILPVRGVCSRITVPEGSRPPHLPCTYSLRFNALEYDYLIPRTDGSIVVGGARAAFWYDRDSWWNNIHDNEQVESSDQAKIRSMETDMAAVKERLASLESLLRGLQVPKEDPVIDGPLLAS